MNKAVNNNVVWSHRGIIPIAFHDNVFLDLNLSFATGATGRKMREKLLFVLSNGDMTSSHAGEVST